VPRAADDLHGAFVHKARELGGTLTAAPSAAS